MSAQIVKQATSTMSLSGGQCFNDLLCWMLFNDLEVDADLAINYVNLLNVLTNDVQITEDYEDMNVSRQKWDMVLNKQSMNEQDNDSNRLNNNLL